MTIELLSPKQKLIFMIFYCLVYPGVDIFMQLLFLKSFFNWLIFNWVYNILLVLNFVLWMVLPKTITQLFINLSIIILSAICCLIFGSPIYLIEENTKNYPLPNIIIWGILFTIYLLIVCSLGVWLIEFCIKKIFCRKNDDKSQENKRI